MAIDRIRVHMARFMLNLSRYITANCGNHYNFTMVVHRKICRSNRAITHFIASLLLLLSVTFPAHALEQGKPLRIGITPVFLSEHTSLLLDWQRYLELRLGRLVKFVQRGSYREITEMLITNDIEFAWLCGYSYIKKRTSLQLVAVPEYHGEPYYRSYLIVPANDTQTKSINDLNDTIFAYSDPDSNSGFLVPYADLIKKGHDPEEFFLRAFFTRSHRGVVEAVASELANGGSVDGYVWDTLARFEPKLTQATRIVSKSPKFGFPPIVAGIQTRSGDIEKFYHVLSQMDQNPEGRTILDRLNIDGFSSVTPNLYTDIETMSQLIEQAR